MIRKKDLAFSRGHKLDEASLHFLHTAFARWDKNLPPAEVPFVKLLGREIIQNAPIPMVRTPLNECNPRKFLPNLWGKVSHRGLVRTSQSELLTDDYLAQDIELSNCLVEHMIYYMNGDLLRSQIKCAKWN